MESSREMDSESLVQGQFWDLGLAYKVLTH